MKAVASSVIGVAQIQELEAGSSWFVRLHLVYLLGLAVFVSYLLALYLNVRFQLYKRLFFRFCWFSAAAVTICWCWRRGGFS